MSNTICNADDIIDSRDVVARIAEIEEGCQDIIEDIERVQEARTYGRLSESAADEVLKRRNRELEVWDKNNSAELASLMSLQDEAEGYTSDWRHGATLIRDSYFTDYAQEFAEDCGLIRRDAQWPYTCIDWEKAARELQMDYTAVDFGGVTYWVR